MKRVYKYVLAATEQQVLFLPKGSEVLSVAEQRNDMVLYAMVRDDAGEVERHTVRVHGTGHPVHDDPGRFIGTVNLHGGALMFHMFVKKEDG